MKSRRQRFLEARDRVLTDHAETFRRLAEKEADEAAVKAARSEHGRISWATVKRWLGLD